MDTLEKITREMNAVSDDVEAEVSDRRFHYLTRFHMCTHSQTALDATAGIPVNDGLAPVKLLPCSVVIAAGAEPLESPVETR